MHILKPHVVQQGKMPESPKWTSNHRKIESLRKLLRPWLLCGSPSPLNDIHGVKHHAQNVPVHKAIRMHTGLPCSKKPQLCATPRCHLNVANEAEVMMEEAGSRALSDLMLCIIGCVVLSWDLGSRITKGLMNMRLHPGSKEAATPRESCSSLDCCSQSHAQS